MGLFVVSFYQYHHQYHQCCRFSNYFYYCSTSPSRYSEFLKKIGKKSLNWIPFSCFISQYWRSQRMKWIFNQQYIHHHIHVHNYCFFLCLPLNSSSLFLIFVVIFAHAVIKSLPPLHHYHHHFPNHFFCSSNIFIIIIFPITLFVLLIL